MLFFASEVLSLPDSQRKFYFVFIFAAYKDFFKCGNTDFLHWTSNFLFTALSIHISIFFSVTSAIRELSWLHLVPTAVYFVTFPSFFALETQSNRNGYRMDFSGSSNWVFSSIFHMQRDNPWDSLSAPYDQFICQHLQNTLIRACVKCSRSHVKWLPRTQCGLRVRKNYIFFLNQLCRHDVYVNRSFCSILRVS